MVMHGRAVARLEVKHPGAKILGFEEVAVSDLLRARLFDLLLEVKEVHLVPLR